MEVAFRAKVALEGSKSKNLRITVPAQLVKDLELPRPGWLRLRLGNLRFFAFGRWPQSRSSMQVTLPVWLQERPDVGRTIALAVEDAEPYRARLLRPDVFDGFDWLRYVPDRYFATDEHGILRLWSQYELPFALRRIAPREPIERLLEAYRKHGGKSLDAQDWTITKLDGADLDVLGVDPARIKRRNGVTRITKSGPLLRLFLAALKEKGPEDESSSP